MMIPPEDSDLTPGNPDEHEEEDEPEEEVVDELNNQIDGIISKFNSKIIDRLLVNPWNALSPSDIQGFTDYIEYQFVKARVALKDELYDDIAIRLGCIYEKVIYQMGWIARGFWMWEGEGKIAKNDTHYKDLSEIQAQLQKFFERKSKKENVAKDNGVWGSTLNNLQTEVKNLRNRAAHPNYRGEFIEISRGDIERALYKFNQEIENLSIMSELVSTVTIDDLLFLAR